MTRPITFKKVWAQSLVETLCPAPCKGGKT